MKKYVKKYWYKNPLPNKNTVIKGYNVYYM